MIDNESAVDQSHRLSQKGRLSGPGQMGSLRPETARGREAKNSNAVAQPCTSNARARSPRAPVARLSLENSRKFASLLEGLMKECSLHSVYALFLQADFPRATLHRWLSGRVRIPLAAARALIEALLEHATKWKSNASLQQLEDLIRGEIADDSAATRLCTELRVRGIPIGRTIEALRAVNLLPPDARTR